MMSKWYPKTAPKIREKDLSNLKFTAFVVMLAMLWVVANLIGVITTENILYTILYTILIIFSILIVYDKTIGDKEGFKFTRPGAVAGVLFGLAYIFISTQSGTVALGVPGFSVVLIVLIAPYVETIGFQGALHDLVEDKLVEYGALKKGQLSLFISSAITSAVFAVFHIKAYGLSNQTAFYGAFIFSMAGIYWKEKYNDQVPTWIGHFMWNMYFAISTGLIGV